MYYPAYYRKEILPKWLGFDTSYLNTNNGVIRLNAAGAGPVTAGFKQPYASVEGLDGGMGTPFEVRSIVFADSTDLTPNADFTIVLEELGEVRDFMNNPIHIRTIAGTAQTPGFLNEPYMFLSQHNIQAQFVKVAGGQTNVRVFLCGAEYFPWSPEFMRRKKASADIQAVIKKWINRRKYVTPYWLTLDEQNVDVAANATNQFYMKIGNDGHFEGFKVASVSTGTFNWELQEPKTQQTIMNGQVTSATGTGTANFPALWPTAYLIPAGYRLRLQITDTSGAPNRIFFTISGRKIYAPFKQVEEVLRDTRVDTPSVPTPADMPSQIVPAPLV
jgi:hypothetical protein